MSKRVLWVVEEDWGFFGVWEPLAGSAQPTRKQGRLAVKDYSEMHPLNGYRLTKYEATH